MLRAVDRGSHVGERTDEHEELRVKGRKQDVLSRSRRRLRDDEDMESGRVRKKRFQAAVKSLARKQRRG